MYTQLQLRGAARPPVNVSTLQKMKADGDKIACLTCYDASFAVLLDDAEVDVVLVGDSLGMVIQGHDTTVPVTMEHIVYHSTVVARGLYRPFLIADMPFMSYASKEQALQNAVRLMQEGGAKMVPEDEILEALFFAHESVQPILDAQEQLRASVGRPKRAYTPPTLDPALLARVKELATPGLLWQLSRARARQRS